MTREEWDECAVRAHQLFAFGQKVAESKGLILVDTKYEFGKDEHGNILLVDEIHTPDSRSALFLQVPCCSLYSLLLLLLSVDFCSRYWMAESYEARMAAGLEPESVDKEFLRLWFREVRSIVWPTSTTSFTSDTTPHRAIHSTATRTTTRHCPKRLRSW